jgi:hypothetical protein
LSELQVQNAITRQKKEEIVKELQGKLESSVIVFGLRFKNLNVSSLKAHWQQQEQVRQSTGSTFAWTDAALEAQLEQKPEASTAAAATAAGSAAAIAGYQQC